MNQLLLLAGVVIVACKQKITEKKLSPMKTRQIILMDTTRLWVEQLFPSMKCVHYTTVRDALPI